MRLGLGISIPGTSGLVQSAFSPLDLSPVLWLDASDTSTITESGGAVSQWDSKVGSYSAVQATAANQPTTGATTVNSLNVLDFDGSDGMSIASFDMTGGQQFSIAAVFNASSGSSQNLMEHSTYYFNNPGAWIVLRNSSDNVSLTKRGSGVLSSFRTDGTVTTTTAVFVATHDGTLSTDETSGWLNSDGAGTRPNNDNTNSNNRNDTLYIGSRAVTSLFLTGSIAELIVGTTVWSATERSDLESYLANKWGITL